MRKVFLKYVLVALAIALLCGGTPVQAKVPEVGTIITKANWTEYQEVMPDGMIEMFKGTFFWAVPDDVAIEVGPHTPFNDPPKYAQDSEKYKGQATLSPAQGGGMKLTNYTAGLPFPDPQEPNLATKIFYNQYYRYSSPYQRFDWYVVFVDRYHNESEMSGYSVYTKMNYLSEPDMPTKMAGTGDNFFSLYQEVLEPEQTRYTAQLITYFNETDSAEQNYAFIPSMRRSLRLSSASRCSPILGTDWTPEDLNRVPAHFTPVFLREQKILAMVNADSISKKDFSKPQYFPTQKNGKWEIRDVWVIDAQRSPEFMEGYCYGGRHLYLDKETYAPLWTDTFDINGKFFKILSNFRKPVPLPGHGEGQYVMPLLGEDLFIAWDVQNEHISASNVVNVTLGTDVPKGIRDFKRFALPTGLNEVMK